MSPLVEEEKDRDTGTALVDGAGCFHQPAVLSGVVKVVEYQREESFGLVAPLFRFSSEDEASRWRMTPSTV